MSSRARCLLEGAVCLNLNFLGARRSRLCHERSAERKLDAATEAARAEGLPVEEVLRREHLLRRVGLYGTFVLSVACIAGALVGVHLGWATAVSAVLALTPGLLIGIAQGMTEDR